MRRLVSALVFGFKRTPKRLQDSAVHRVRKPTTFKQVKVDGKSLCYSAPTRLVLCEPDALSRGAIRKHKTNAWRMALSATRHAQTHGGQNLELITVMLANRNAGRDPKQILH